jgi:hypothetical protein
VGTLRAGCDIEGPTRAGDRLGDGPATISRPHPLQVDRGARPVNP